jgi:hypothetical protein
VAIVFKMRLLLITLVGTILGCTRVSDPGLKNSDKIDTLITADNVELDSLDFNIIKYDTSYNYIFPKTFKAIDLNDEEIMECETLLRLFIADYNVEATKRFDEMTKKYPKLKFNKNQFTIELRDYGRQYMAALSENEKFVYVNCFCDPVEFDYRHKELVQVDDGGNCFFSFKVDLKNKKIFDFRENGVA